MDDKIKKKLIDVFSAHKMPELEDNDGALLKDSLGAELVNNDTYEKYFTTLKELREKLDDALTEAEDLAQVKECLCLLKEEKENPPGESAELLSKLITKGVYKNGWDDAAKTYYDTGREMLFEWKDFFLSYTNRNLNETNNNFDDTLSAVFGETDFKNKREKVNCVARLMAHYLEMNNVSAFFDQESMTCGDDIEDEVFDHCKAVYGFVQLVEPVIFRTRQQEKNWCHLEFNTFNEWSSQNHLKPYKRFYFIVTENNVFPANLPNEYKGWKDTIDAHLHVSDLSSLNRKEIRNKVGEIAGEIVKAKGQALEAYIEL